MHHTLYTTVSLGCHADGSFGHDHVRAALAIIMDRVEAKCGHPGTAQTAHELAELLRAPMSDDASEENDAIDLVNQTVCDGVYFALENGDLMLLYET